MTFERQPHQIDEISLFQFKVKDHETIFYRARLSETFAILRYIINLVNYLLYYQ